MKTVWIFLADKILDDATARQIRSEIDRFLADWKDHGKPIRSSLEVVHNAYFIVRAHEERVDGCPVDDLYAFFKELGSRYSIDFLDRFRVGYLDADGRLHLVSLHDLPQLYREGRITDETLFYNHVANTPDELQHWRQPLKDSWIARFVR